MTQQDYRIEAVTADQALVLADQLSGIDPWLRLGFTAQDFRHLISNTRPPEGEACAILNNNDLAGLVVIRRNWLFGDYLKILAVIPQAQRQGVGQQTLRTIAARSRESGAKNLWACVSAFNSAALDFYDNNGFERIGTLSDLVVEGEDEILVRLRLPMISAIS